MEADCVTRGETPWFSQESPKRPGMLMLYGKVKTWLFDSLTMVTTIRPPAPPLTGSAQFKKEAEEIYQMQKNLTREQRAIATFWSDGVGTYTPPGHWNYIAASAFAQLNYSEARWARNMALLNMSIMDAGVVCWDTKYVYYNPRPMQIDTRIKTDIGLPNFPAYISGHSTFSGAASTVLAYIVPGKAQQFFDMAKEASISRMYGAIHFRSDCEVGITTGNKVGSYAVTRGHTDGAE
jgi:hypothetical protein